MIEVGVYHELEVLRLGKAGAVLGGDGFTVPLVRKQVPRGTEIGDVIRVFVYTDASGAVATTDTPYVTVGGFAYLEVVDVTRHGAFLDWGLAKDLFVPFARMHEPLRIGDGVVVGVTVHAATNRVIGSSALSSLFDDDSSGFELGQEVDLLVFDFSDRGARVVVDGTHGGLVYDDQIFRDLHIGDTLKGFVDRIRDDGRLDITLQRTGRAGTTDAQQIVLDALQAADGFLPLHDKSPPDAIKQALGMSKKVFKKAIGGLYKARRIALGPDGIRLTPGGDSTPRP